METCPVLSSSDVFSSILKTIVPFLTALVSTYEIQLYPGATITIGSSRFVWKGTSKAPPVAGTLAANADSPRVKTPSSQDRIRAAVVPSPFTAIIYTFPVVNGLGAVI